MLSRFDDYPIHQTPDPIATPASSDKDVYERYWFNCYSTAGDLYLGIPPGHPEQAASPASNADMTDRQALGRTRGEHTWNEGGQGYEGRRARQEAAARQVSIA